MHLLVTGRDGQVAQALMRSATEGLKVTAMGRPDLDLTQPESIARAIARAKPDLLVNAAAYTAVDKAESEPDAAFAVNRDGARNAAAAAAAAGLPIIHISTDYVFAGDKDGPYVESDPTGPTGVYGASKLAGEEAVAAANANHVILRTAWVYSDYGNNFVKTMLRVAATRDVLRVVDDQHGTPTHAADIAEAIAVVAHRLTGDAAGDFNGVFHLVSGGATTWAGFAREIFAVSAAAGGPAAEVDPITTADYPTPARRPANSRLNTRRFVEAFGWTPPPWQAGTAQCVLRLVGSDGRKTG